MNKTPLFFLIAIILVLISTSSSAFAQSNQNLILKPGFNFVSFSVTPTVSAAAFKSANPSIENIFIYSAAAGSFLSVNEGTLTTLAAGKGYIVKNSNTSDLTIALPGSVPATIGNINLKTGFNLIGFAKTPAAVTFNKLMDVYPVIKGLYKWSTSAGGFIQVIRNESGVPVQLDGINPSFKAGESYFINMAGDTTLNYDGADVIVGSGPPPVAVAKTFEVSGPIGSALKTPYLTSISRLIDNSGYRISIFDEINNQSLEDSTVSLIAADTYRAVIKTASTTKYASIIVKNLENKVIYKIFLGRIPKSEEISDSSIKITNLRIDDSSTARAIVISGYKSRIPASAIIANKSLDASVEETVFVKETKSSFGNINSIASELEKVVSVIRGVLAKETIESFIRGYIEVSTHDSLNNTLNAYVKLLNHFDYLSYKQGISIPAYIYIGAAILKEGSTSETVQKALSEAEILINKSILKTIELDKVTDSVLISKQYDLSLITAMAVYSDNSKKKIIPYWKRQSGKGTVWVDGGKWVFDASSETGETILDAGYDEDGGAVKKTAQLTLHTVSDKPVVAAANLISWAQDYSVPTYTNIKPGDKIRLGSTKAALYSNGSTRDIKIIWKVLEGAGTLAEVDYYTLEYTAPMTEGIVKLEGNYSEGGVTLKPIQNFNFNVTNDLNTSIIDQKKSNIGQNGGQITLYSGASLDFAQGIAGDSAEIVLSEIVSYDSSIVKEPYTSLYKISTSGMFRGNVNLNIPIKDSTLSEDFVYLEIIDPTNNKTEKLPFSINKISNAPKFENNKSILLEVIFASIKVPLTFVFGIEIGLQTRQAYRYVRYNSFKPKTPQNNSISLKVPYYRQYNGDCVAACLLMILKAHGVNSSVYEIMKLLDIDKNIGLSISFPASGSPPDLYLGGSVRKIEKLFNDKISKETVHEQLLGKCRAEFFNDLITSLDGGVPMVLFYHQVGKAPHAVVIVGYSNGNTIGSDKNFSKLVFKVHDPSLKANKEYTYAELIAEAWSDIWNIHAMGWGPFIERNFISVHIPDVDGLLNYSGHCVGYTLNKDDSPSNHAIAWSNKYQYGYYLLGQENTFPTTVSENFYDLQFKKLAIFNVGDQDLDLFVKTSVIGGKYNDLITSSELKPIKVVAIKNYNDPVECLNDKHYFDANRIIGDDVRKSLLFNKIKHLDDDTAFNVSISVGYQVPNQILLSTLPMTFVPMDTTTFKLNFEKLYILSPESKFEQTEITMYADETIKLNSCLNSCANPVITRWEIPQNIKGEFSINPGYTCTYKGPGSTSEDYSFELITNYEWFQRLKANIKINVKKRL